MKKKDSIDYCTLFPETWRGVDISMCCKLHDNTYSTSKFYNCLSTKINRLPAVLITVGGAIGCWVKCPITMLKRL